MFASLIYQIITLIMTDIDEQIKKAELEKILIETSVLKKKNSRWTPAMFLIGTFGAGLLSLFTVWSQYTRSSIADRESAIQARVESVEARESVLAIDAELQQKKIFLQDEENRLQEVQDEIRLKTEQLAEVATDAGANHVEVAILKEEVIKLSRPSKPNIELAANLKRPTSDAVYQISTIRPTGNIIYQVPTERPSAPTD